MTDDRSAFTEARDAGLQRRHETREARAIRRQVAEEIAAACEELARRINPSAAVPTLGIVSINRICKAIGSEETS